MKLYNITFSPTGGTRKAAALLIGGLEGEVCQVDLTDSRLDPGSVQLAEEDVAVISVPSYGGRVPTVAVERLTALKGGGARAVLVCVYGNRAYEDTLVELEDAAKQAGFRVIAAVAAIAEHSIARQFATGRPDEQDAQQLAGFARQIRDKIAAGSCAEPAIPGNRPYKKPGGSGMMPKPTKACTGCGVCARECPVQAIDPNDPGKVDEKACISCMRCIKVCPAGARKLDPAGIAAVEQRLSKICGERKENELYI